MVAPATSKHFPPGALVRARGREWVVLPPDTPDVLRLRPLTGDNDEVTGLFLPLEGRNVEPASFAPPDPSRAGDALGGLLLRDAVRLRLREGAAPFRSLGKISVTPRPYQFVPLIMALRQNVVRLLIADDVGVGKTIEAGMIARELLDRGLVRRIAVLCPAHLCEQWEAELAEKFGLRAARVQPSTIGRLERDLPRPDISLYQYYPHFIASVDFVKSGRNRAPFLQYAPELVIVDEAHAATRPRGDTERIQQERYALVRDLASDPRRHLILVTATPHSGIEESFRSLLGLLDERFDTAMEFPLERRELLPHVVQRRRRDLEQWLGSETPFPEREATEDFYNLSPEYRQLFGEVLNYCREAVTDRAGLRAAQQRVRYWGAIALLRSVLSSPDAAIAALEGKQDRLQDRVTFESVDEVDDTYLPQVLGSAEDDESPDYVPSAPIQDSAHLLTDAERRSLAQLVRRARELRGPTADRKLAKTAELVARLLREGHRPIVFCHYIATADYVAEHLHTVLSLEYPSVRVVSVTGELGDEVRREKVEELAHEQRPVLVATDCLSEGINLQEWFDAVVHYDLPWNPNRLQQREGRVDRFGQPKDRVKAVLVYGADNDVDLVVLDVLIRKSQAIYRDLGIAVPIPPGAQQVVEAVVETVLLRGPVRPQQLRMEFMPPSVSQLHLQMDAAAARQKESAAYFRQQGIKPAEVARELEDTDPVLGDVAAVERFLANALQRFGGQLQPTQKDGVFELHPGDLRTKVSLALSPAPEPDPLESSDARRGPAFPLRLVFDKAKDPKAMVLGRTQPVIVATCDAVLAEALSPNGDPRFARCGAMYTRSVSTRTAVVLARLRYILHEERDQFAEEVVLAAFQRTDGGLRWLEPLENAAREALEAAVSAANMGPQERGEHVAWALDQLATQAAWFELIVESRRATLVGSHNRLRALARAAPLTVQPHTPPDIIGLYVLVPAGNR